jgi:hypothetical protein
LFFNVAAHSKRALARMARHEFSLFLFASSFD